MRRPPVIVRTDMGGSAPEASPISPENESGYTGCSVPPERFDRRDYAAMGLLVLGLVAMFWKVLFTSQMFYIRDVYNYTYPHAKFIHDAIHHGYLPYWNPLLNYGEPLLADPNFLFFYPATLLIILLPVAYAYCLHYVLHFAIAAVGTYCLARRWRQSMPAALFAAAAFAFSGPLLSLGNFYNHSACAAWIPCALLVTDIALHSRSLRPWILLAVVFTLQFLAGEMFTLLATYGLCLAYAVFQAGKLTQPRRASNRKIIAAFGVVGLVMVALCAVQLLPAMHLLANSRRGIQGMAFNETTYWSFNPLRLIEIVLPGFFGWPLEGSTLWNFVLDGRNYPYLLSIFVGPVTLFFALLGWVFSSDRRRKFAAAASAVLLILSFGRFTPVFALAYLLFPPLEMVRFPVKLLVPATLLVALLAGWGLDALREPKANWSQRRVLIVNSLACLLLIVAFCLGLSFLAPETLTQIGSVILEVSNQAYWHKPQDSLSAAQAAGAARFLLTMVKIYFPGLAGILLGGLLWFIRLEQGKQWARKAVPFVAVLGIAHLALVNYSANPTVPKAFYTYQPPVFSAMAPTQQPYRICPMYRKKPRAHNAPNPQAFLNFKSIPFISRLPLAAQNDFRSRLVLSHATMLTGAEIVLNNDVDLSFPTDLFHFWVFIGDQMPDYSRADCLIGRTNVKYEIFDHRQHSSSLRLVGRVFNASSLPSYLYENLCALPRAYVANTAWHSSNPLATLTLLSSSGFDASQMVILRGPENRTLRAPNPASPHHSPAGTVTMIEDKPNTVVLRAHMLRAGYAVLLDRYDPGWRAFVDGQPTTILHANLMFRAIRVGPGEHLIRFEYHQVGLKAGLAITLLTSILLLGLYLTDRVKLAPLEPS